MVRFLYFALLLLASSMSNEPKQMEKSIHHLRFSSNIIMLVLSDDVLHMPITGVLIELLPFKIYVTH